MSFGTIPSWPVALAFVRSCKPDNLPNNCCSRCSRTDRTGKLDRVGNYLDVGELAGAVDSFHTNEDCIRALLASQKPFQVGDTADPWHTHPSRSLGSHLCRRAFDFAAECSD